MSDKGTALLSANLQLNADPGNGSLLASSIFAAIEQ